MEVTVLILCLNYERSRKRFNEFYNFLKDNIPWTIESVIKPANMLIMTDHIKYIFVDSSFYFLDQLIDIYDPDIMDEDEFFEDLYI